MDVDGHAPMLAHLCPGRLGLNVRTVTAPRTRRTLMLAVVACIALVAAACTDDDSPPSAAETTTTTRVCPRAADAGAAPFTIGLINTTGSFPGGRDGAEAAVEYVNCELDGLGGHPLALHACDASPDAASQVQCAEQFAADPDVRMVLTGLLYSADGVYPVLQFASKPVLGGVPYGPADSTATGARFYSAGPSGVISGLGLFAVSRLGAPVTSAGIVVPPGPAGDAVLPFLRPLLEQAGVEVRVARLAVDPDAGAADAALVITAASQAQALFALVAGPACAALAGALAGVSTPPALLTTDLCVDDAVLDAAPDGALDGWYVGSDSLPAGLAPGSNADADTFAEVYPRYASTPPTAAGAATSWSNVLAIVAALTPVGYDGLTSEAISAALDGFRGPRFLGPEHIACPGPVFAALCSTDVYVTQLHERQLAVVGDGAPVDISGFDPAG
jgi:branched-chain amino acid transport system substrate-binding protein